MNNFYKGVLPAVLVAIALLAALSACGGKPMPFPTPESQMPDRPGLFTGESGVQTLYQK
jgi:hypothetical protein